MKIWKHPFTYALLGALALSGCASNGSLNASATATEAEILATACPVLTTVEANAKLNSTQTAALNSLLVACQLPPTNVVTATLDIITAYGDLQPILKNYIK